MQPLDLPAMSAILLTPDKASRLQKTLEHLRQQTIADQLEIVLVAPKASELEPDQAALEGFHSVQVVETGRQVISYFWQERRRPPTSISHLLDLW